MAKYTVIRTVSYCEECVVEAHSEEEAVSIAMNKDDWDTSPNTEFLDPYEYIALIEDE